MPLEEVMTLHWKLSDYNLVSTMNIKDMEVFLAKSPANPVTDWRTSIILRRRAKKAVFQMNWVL
jgi:hypothetical protein